MLRLIGVWVARVEMDLVGFYNYAAACILGDHGSGGMPDTL